MQGFDWRARCGVRRPHSLHTALITRGSGLAFPIPVRRATVSPVAPVDNERPRALRWCGARHRGCGAGLSRYAEAGGLFRPASPCGVWVWPGFLRRLVRATTRGRVRRVPPAPSMLAAGKERAARRVGIVGDAPGAPHTTGQCAKCPSSNMVPAGHADMRNGTRLAPAFSGQKSANTRDS